MQSRCSSYPKEKLLNYPFKWLLYSIKRLVWWLGPCNNVACTVWLPVHAVDAQLLWHEDSILDHFNSRSCERWWALIFLFASSFSWGGNRGGEELSYSLILVWLWNRQSCIVQLNQFQFWRKISSAAWWLFLCGLIFSSCHVKVNEQSFCWAPYLLLLSMSELSTRNSVLDHNKLTPSCLVWSSEQKRQILYVPSEHVCFFLFPLNLITWQASNE